MRELWQHHYNDVAAYDRAKWSSTNRTRFYGYFLRNGSDLQLHTIALKRRKDGTAVTKDVTILSVNSDEMYIRDLFYGNMCGYMVDWSKEQLGNKLTWAYPEGWAKEPYTTRSNLWKIRCPIVNPDELIAHERFKYCGWRVGIGSNPIDYLKAYVKHPRIELLTKAGLGWMATKSGFIRALEKDKRLLQFVMANIQQCRMADIPAIRLAYKTGVSVAHAAITLDNRRKFRGLGLPEEINRDKAHDYVMSSHIPLDHYVSHLQRCAELGLNLEDTKVSYPRYFKARYKEIFDKWEAVRVMKKLKERQQYNRSIRTVADKLSAIERVRSKKYKAVLPRKIGDFIAEGKNLNNCLGEGHYTTRVARRESLIVFIRKAKSRARSYVAVEYDIKNRRILQCYGRNNSKPAVDTIKFVNKMFERAAVKAALESVTAKGA